MGDKITNTPIEVDLKEFFQAFFPDEKSTIYFRTFNDKDKNEKGGRKKDVVLWRLEGILPSLKKENKENRGVFFVVNGGGQTDEAVIASESCTAQFMEMDQGTFEEQLETINNFPIRPSIVVRTRKSLHTYWLLKDGNIKRFREIQLRLVAYFNSDSTVQNESRVMRVPGFNHCKADPAKVEVIHFAPELRYTQDELEAVLPEAAPPSPGPSVQCNIANGEKVPKGQRRKYMLSRVGELINKMIDFDDSTIVAAAMDVAHNKLDLTEPLDTGWEGLQRDLEKVVRDFRSAKEKDLANGSKEKWSYDVQAWHEEHPGETLKRPINWREVAAAGDRKREREAAQEIENTTEVIEVVPTDITNATREQLFSADFIRGALKNNTLPPEKVKELLLERAAELKCKTDLRTFIAKVEKDQEEHRIAKMITGYTEFEHKALNKPLMIGDNFISEDGKIYGIKRAKSENGIDELQLVCPCMVYPLERRCNIGNGTERITIAFYKDGKWKERTIDRLQIADSRKAIELTEFGLPINTITAKKFIGYMATVECMNPDIPIVNTSNSFGWVQDPDGSKEFVPYSDKVKFDGVEEYKDLARAIKPHGSKEKWFDYVKKIRSNTNKCFLPQLYMSASCASVLVRLLNQDVIWPNGWGPSGRGKTTSLKLAASVWGNPNDGRYITMGDTTPNALFFKASVLKHLPLIIDDFSKMAKRKDFDIESLIYALCSGTDRARGNKNRSVDEVKTWQNVILSSYERPLIDENMKGGAINRVLDFEIPNQDIFEDTDEFYEIIPNNYGFLGPMFIEKVLELGPEKVTELQKDFAKKIIAAAEELGEKKEAKQIKPLSVILAADKIAAEIFQDGVLLNVKQLTRQLKSSDEVSDGQRAYDFLMDYIAINRRNFIDLDRRDLSEDKDFNPMVEVFGYLGSIKEDPNKYLFFNGEQLQRVFKNTNHNTKVLLNWLKEKQLIKLSGSNGFMTTKKILKRTQKVYAIKIPKEKEDLVTI